MAFKRKPEGTALTHHTEYRAADATVWKYRGSLLARGLDFDDVAGDIVIHLLTKKHMYDPDKAKFSTWCRFLAERYVWRLIEKADIRSKHMQAWRPPSYVEWPQDRNGRIEFAHELLGTPLPDRQRKILLAWLDGKSLRDIAAQFSLSAERIRQIVRRAVEKIRDRAYQMAHRSHASFADYWERI